MDLIYMNSEMVDLGILQDFELDLAFGANENNFECRIPSYMHCCDAGYYLYVEGKEYGGTIDTLEVASDANEVVYYGRTWHGILGSKVIQPLKEGDASTPDVTIKTEDSNGVSLVDKYLVISGDANHCIQFILNRIGLSELFKATETASGIYVKGYQFDRYTDAYTGLSKMLGTVNMRLHIAYQEKAVVLSAVERYDYTTDEEFDPELVEMQLKKKVKAVNHLICLGKGELENRTVIHLYADSSGNISQTQTQFGLQEYTAVYDYSSVESEEELLKQGTEQLKALWVPDEMVINLDDTSDFYDVGDKVGATDNITGLSATATIQKKIVNIRNGLVSISYEVGE